MEENIDPSYFDSLPDELLVHQCNIMTTPQLLNLAENYKRVGIVCDTIINQRKQEFEKKRTGCKVVVSVRKRTDIPSDRRLNAIRALGPQYIREGKSKYWSATTNKYYPIQDISLSKDDGLRLHIVGSTYRDVKWDDFCYDDFTPFVSSDY